MLVTHKLEFDFVKPGVEQRVEAMQNDSMTRAVEASLLCNGQPWTVPDGVNVAVAYRKEDKTSGLYDELPTGDSTKATFNADRTVVTVILAPQALTYPGEVSACLTLMDNALNKLSTFTFKILVAENPSANGGVSNDYYNYQDLADINDHLQGIIEGTFPIYTDKTLTVPQRAADAKATGDAIAALGADLSAVDGSSAIVAEATGGIITLNDASNRLLQGLTVYGKTTQNGTPTPENPVELVNVGKDGTVEVSVCGKNLLDTTKWVDSEANGVSLIQSGGDIVANGEAAAAFSKIVAVDLHLPEGEYTFSAEIVRGTLSSGYLMPTVSQYADGSVAENYASLTPTRTKAAKVFSIVSGGYISRWYILVGAGTVADNVVIRLQLEAGADATEYEAYKSARSIAISTPNGLPGLPVTSGGNYTDESGQQWICDEVDLSRGVYVQRIRTREFTGTETWALDSVGLTYERARVLLEDATPRSQPMCNMCPGIDPSDAAQGWNGTEMVAVITSEQYIYVYRPTKQLPDVNSAGAWKAWLAEQYVAGTPFTVAYAIVEPVETVLDKATLAAYAALHTNKPNTTILNDAGAGMKVEYVADTKAYIDNKFAALTAAIMNT